VKARTAAHALLVLLAFAAGLAGAVAITATLTTPSSDPDINTNQAFSMQVTVSCAGSGPGPCSSVFVYPQYCAGSGCSNFTDMTTSTFGLKSDVNNVSLGNINKNSNKVANFTINGTANNTYVIRGYAVSSDSGTSTSGTQTVTVRSPASLSATLSASPSSVNDSGTITVTMAVSNTGQRAAVNVTPSSLTVSATGTAGASPLTGPSPSIANITGGSSQNFTWTYNASGGASGGNISFSGNASGKDNKTGSTVTSSNAVSNSVTVASRPTANATLTAPSSDPDLNTGQTFTLSVQVSCSSGSCANVVVYPRYCTGSLSCTPNADITTSTTDLTSNVNSVSLGTVNAGSPQTASFTITGTSNNTYTVGGRFTSTPNNGNATGTQGVSVKSPSSISAAITASPSSVAEGDNITVTMNVSNSGQRAAANVTPSALTVNTVTGTASASLLTGPSPSAANITGLGWATFNWTYNASAGAGGGGNITFTGSASGKDNRTGGSISTSAANSNAVAVSGGILNATLTAPASNPDINEGQGFTLTVNVSCSNSGANCKGVVVYPRYCNTSLSCTPNSDITTSTTDLASSSNSASLGTINKGTSSTASFTITGNLNGSYQLGGRFTSTNSNNGSTGSFQPLSVKKAANLSASISASPNPANDGDNVTVTMSVSNTGERDAVNVTPSSLTVTVINGTANASLLTGPSPSIANITGGGSQNFTWVYNASSGASGGNISFSGNASGKDNKTGSTVTSNNANSGAVNVRKKGTNLSIWDETDADRPYANMTRYAGDAVAFYANCTKSSDNSSLSNATCQLSINNGTNWTAWSNMSWNATKSLFQYNYTAGFPGNGTFAWNATCNESGYDDASANDTVNVSLHNSSLAIWDDTDSATRYTGDQVYFYANYTLSNGTIIDSNATCNASFNISGGWTAWAGMAYNTSSTPYYYGRSFTDNGTFNFNVSCSKPSYQQQNATSNFTITTAPTSAYVTTGKSSYRACVPVYYRVRMLDSYDFLVNAQFSLDISDSGGTTRRYSAALNPNNGTGVYTDSISVNSTGPSGNWFIKVISGTATGTMQFGVLP